MDAKFYLLAIKLLFYATLNVQWVDAEKPRRVGFN